MKRFPWLLTLAVAVMLAALVALGTWQARRLAWKTGLIAAAEAAAARPPVPLRQALAEPDPEFRRVTVDCPGLASAPVVRLQAVLDGQAGVRLVSACLPPRRQGDAGAEAYLIDRGFVADDVGDGAAEPSPGPPPGPVVEALTAQVRTAPPPGRMAPPPGQGRFYARDTPAMARALGLDPARVGPQTLYALTSSDPQWPALRPSAPPAAFSNNHLGYAITWYGLAAALAGVYVALLRRRKAEAPR